MSEWQISHRKCVIFEGVQYAYHYYVVRTIVYNYSRVFNVLTVFRVAILYTIADSFIYCFTIFDRIVLKWSNPLGNRVKNACFKDITLRKVLVEELKTTLFYWSCFAIKSIKVFDCCTGKHRRSSLRSEKVSHTNTNLTYASDRYNS